MKMNNAKAAVIFVAVLMMTSLTLIAFPIPAQAQTNIRDSGGVLNIPSGVTPDYTLTYAPYLSVRPNPIGLDQNFLINMWMIPAFQQVQYMKDYKVTITKPDGTTDIITMDSYYGDLTAWFEYPADQVGEWSFKFSYPGGYYAAGNYSSPQNRRGGILNPLLNDTLTRSYPYSFYMNPVETGVTKVTVQQEMIASYPSVPLPTDYWTRPVQVQNREWWSILGGYPWYGPGGGPNFPADTNKYAGGYGFIPYVQAPNSAHIVWKREGTIGGLVGAFTTLDPNTASALSWAEGSGNPSIFYAGRCYQSITLPRENFVNGAIQVLPTNMFVCYDIRTGETLWERTASSMNVPTQLVYEAGSGDVPGAEAIRGQEVYLQYIGGGRLVKYNPYNGATALNVSIAPLTTGTMYQNGWCLTVQDLGAAAANAPGGRYRLINWTTTATATTLADRIISNTTYTRNSIPGTVDYESGYSATYSNVNNPATTAAYKETNITAYRLSTGETMWSTIFPEANYQGTMVDHGKVAVNMRDGSYVAYDLATGQQAWISEKRDYPWGQATFGNYGANSGYGLLIWQAYDAVYAINWTNGKIAWKYHAYSAPFETPYTDGNGANVLSWDSTGRIADGKLFVQNSEHSPTQPLTRGWRLHAIDMMTGEAVWTILGEMAAGVVGDGYLTASNTYDGIMYVFGKGKSATTVTAPDTAISLGTALTIKGTVLDLSPAQPNTPCVSKDSMSTQMEYLHMQMPIGGLWGNETITGVPVTLTAIDGNGTVYDLGSVTTNGYYGTFSKAWTPPAEGTYEIIASFASDESYGSSAAATAVTVGAAPAETIIPEQIVPPDYTWTIIGSAIAVMIVVAIVGALIMMRKR